MKLECIDENTIIVFLNRLKQEDKFILSSIYLENYFRLLFKVLKNQYKLDISGYYSIHLYQDSIYGAVICIKKEFVDYFDSFDNQVDMKIEIEKDIPILYEVDPISFISEEIYPYLYVYFYQDKVYIKPKKTISQINLGRIIENSTIIYGEKCKEILKKGKLIKSKYIFI